MEPREVLVEIYNEIKETKDCLYLAQKALIYNSLRPLNIAEEVMKEMHQKNEFVMDKLKEEVKEQPAASIYIPIPKHFEKIRGHTLGIIAGLKEKVSQGVSFSDEAMSALNFLIEKIIELLNNTADLVLAKNTVIYGYVKATKNAIAMSTDDYEKRQEKQSAGDKGKAKSLKLFITILDSLKAITTHTGTIAEELFK
jgi:Na+/phosphate symporter